MRHVAALLPPATLRVEFYADDAASARGARARRACCAMIDAGVPARARAPAQRAQWQQCCGAMPPRCVLMLPICKMRCQSFDITLALRDVDAALPVYASAVVILSFAERDIIYARRMFDAARALPQALSMIFDDC